MSRNKRGLYGVIGLLLLGTCPCWGQVAATGPGVGVDSSLRAALLKGRLSLEGYVDVYYSYAFSHPVGGTRPYVVNYNRDNEINLDLAYISLKYTTDRLRATFTPGYGTYMNANYAAERQTLQNILEASARACGFLRTRISGWMGVSSALPYTNESVYSSDQLTEYPITGGGEYALLSDGCEADGAFWSWVDGLFLFAEWPGR